MSREFKLNRFFSDLITPIFLKTPVTPNQVTMLSLGCGLASGHFFAKGTYGTMLAGAVFFNLAAILDNCDGDIARAKKMGSTFGGWLDVGVDVFVDFAFFLGLAIGVHRNAPESPAILFGAMCIVGSFLNFLVVVWEKIRGFGPAVYNHSNPEGSGRSGVAFKIADAIREGDSSWFVLIFAALGRPEILLWFGGIYMQILWISSFCMNFKWLVRKKI